MPARPATDPEPASSPTRPGALGPEVGVLPDAARDLASTLELRPLLELLLDHLHDAVTQSLYSIALYTEAAERALADGQIEPAATNVRDSAEATQEALGEMRLLLFELRPPHLDEGGLAAALRSRLQAVEVRAGLTAEFDSQGEGQLAPDEEQELYRLAQEALNNVLKHAHARHVRVRGDLTTDRAVVEVADDGVGFEPSQREADGYGLPGTRERAERLGGILQVESTPGAGTRVRSEAPR